MLTMPRYVVTATSHDGRTVMAYVKAKTPGDALALSRYKPERLRVVPTGEQLDVLTTAGVRTVMPC